MSVVTENAVVLVTGVGRSGTSLAMQALARLGATISCDLVGPSAANRRGALEDVHVRDQMRALWKRLGRFDSLRAKDWRESRAALDAETWLIGHLARIVGNKDGVYAVKFPVSALFLPLWADAAAVAGVPMRVVWATRGAEATISSFLNAYKVKQAVAESRYLQRSFYILTEMPADTFLLPYEGWAESPSEQLAALAAATGLPEPDGAALDGLYAPEMAHATVPSALAPLPNAICAVDRELCGHRGPAEKVLGSPDERKRVALTRHLEEALVERDAVTSGGAVRHAAVDLSIDALINEASRLRAERTRHEAEACKLQREKEAALTEVTELRSSIDALTNEASRLRAERTRHEAEASKLQSEKEATVTEVTELRSANAKLVRECDAMESAQADERADRANEIALERQRAANKATRELSKEIKKIRNSVRWKAASTLSEALRHPGRRTLKLPFELTRLWWHSRRR